MTKYKNIKKNELNKKNDYNARKNRITIDNLKSI